MNPLEGERLVIVRQVPLQQAPGFPALQVRRMLLKVQERPELEARIRDRQLDTVVAGLLKGVVKVGMLINVEDAPDLIEPEEVVTPAACFPLRLPLSLGCPFHEGLRDAACAIDLYLY